MFLYVKRGSEMNHRKFNINWDILIGIEEGIEEFETALSPLHYHPRNKSSEFQKSGFNFWLSGRMEKVGSANHRVGVGLVLSNPVL